eukprot:scaffold398316_cov48-Prasinocladus_malaysianus.AAC.1
MRCKSGQRRLSRPSDPKLHAALTSSALLGSAVSFALSISRLSRPKEGVASGLMQPSSRSFARLSHSRVSTPTARSGKEA